MTKESTKRIAEGEGTFAWPEGVEVVFPDGTVYDCLGARDADGVSIDYNPGGRGECGSPCHQALVKAGYAL